MIIWNLPLHAWSWSIIAEVSRPMGELVVLSQEELPHKQFISALVRRRAGVSLSLDLEPSLGMHKYLVLFTRDKGTLSVYCQELGRFALVDKVVGAAARLMAELRTRKELLQESEMATNSKKKTVVELSSHPGIKRV